MDNELICHSISFRRQHFQIYTLSSVQLKNAAASEWPNPCFTLKREYFTGLAIFRPACSPPVPKLRDLCSLHFKET